MRVAPILGAVGRRKSDSYWMHSMGMSRFSSPGRTLVTYFLTGRLAVVIRVELYLDVKSKADIERKRGGERTGAERKGLRGRLFVQEGKRSILRFESGSDIRMAFPGRTEL